MDWFLYDIDLRRERVNKHLYNQCLQVSGTQCFHSHFRGAPMDFHLSGRGKKSGPFFS